MRNLWRSLLACFRPSWRLSSDPARRAAFLKLGIVAGIFLFAGPELVAALEWQILVEMLGATLFTTAMIAGAKLALVDLGEKLRSLVLPAAPVALLGAAYFEWWLASAAAMVASAQAVWEVVV